MKKLLALVLALVMTLGLATVSSNAAYADAADVGLEEAVDVMSAVGVFQGTDGNKFDPKGNLTREQAAKLIAYLDLGAKTAEALPAVQVFDDVEATRWSAKYIAYCQDAGYIAGVGENKFNPTGALTGYAFGKMVLCVLGYDADIEGFTGSSWSINVAKLMESNKIADGVDGAASATLTREQAAQYCLNALKATMVDYESKGTKVTINGAEIATGASKAKAVATTAATETGAIADDAGSAGTLQLGEKLYDGKLVKDSTGKDALGRPASKWTYTKNNKVTTCGYYTKDATYTLEGKVTYKKLYETIGAEIASQAGTISYSVDGGSATDSRLVAKKTSTDAACNTALGTVMQVYVDTTKAVNNQVKIFVQNTYIGTVKKVTAAAADGTKRFVTLTNGKTFTTEDFAAKDVVLYTLNGTDIFSMTLAEKVEGTYTKKVGTTKFTVDGTEYQISFKGSSDIATAKIGSKVSFYVDGQGNIMKDIDLTTAAEDYILVVGNSAGKASSDYLTSATDTYEVYGVLADGTVKTFTAKKQADGTEATTSAPIVNAYAGKAYAYKLDDDNYIELTAADTNADNDETKVGATKMNGAILNSDTAFVFVETTSDTNKTVKSVTVKTGNKNFGSTIAANKALVCADGGVAKVVFVAGTYSDASTETGNLVYLSGEQTATTTEDGNGTKTTYSYEAYNTDGDKLTVSTSSSTDYRYQVWKYNEDNTLSAVKTSASKVITAINGDTITVGSTALSVASAKEVFLKDDVELAVGQTVTYVVNGDNRAQIDYLWVTADQVTYTLTLTDNVTGATLTTEAYEVIGGTGVANKIKVVATKASGTYNANKTCTLTYTVTGKSGDQTATVTPTEDTKTLTFEITVTAPKKNITIDATSIAQDS